MDTLTQDIVAAALKLSVQDRTTVVQELIDSLPPHATAQIDDAWAAELARRDAEFQSDPTQGTAWSDLKDQR